ncbi:hypothetical protein BU14_1288s0001 [Porphyra umbilicalis]|uniref:Uncharacterized protein n=1 Tax=Porphyra umbilicalis TaxID=2786 RepID=A0A1X6NLZ5_PORUM|nr:hypothetical protein BU14_1288s0001 [Porphyra umbilicalis]|eukprot:OSX69669.1 hypothetical protein BU14_1288s0001 [Porphyra umbilicalis]
MIPPAPTAPPHAATPPCPRSFPLGCSRGGLRGAAGGTPLTGHQSTKRQNIHGRRSRPPCPVPRAPGDARPRSRRPCCPLRGSAPSPAVSSTARHQKQQEQRTNSRLSPCASPTTIAPRQSTADPPHRPARRVAPGLMDAASMVVGLHRAVVRGHLIHRGPAARAQGPAAACAAAAAGRRHHRLVDKQYPAIRDRPHWLAAAGECIVRGARHNGRGGDRVDRHVHVVLPAAVGGIGPRRHVDLAVRIIVGHQLRAGGDVKQLCDKEGCELWVIPPIQQHFSCLRVVRRQVAAVRTGGGLQKRRHDHQVRRPVVRVIQPRVGAHAQVVARPNAGAGAERRDAGIGDRDVADGGEDGLIPFLPRQGGDGGGGGRLCGARGGARRRHLGLVSFSWTLRVWEVGGGGSGREVARGRLGAEQ